MLLTFWGQSATQPVSAQLLDQNLVAAFHSRQSALENCKDVRDSVCQLHLSDAQAFQGGLATVQRSHSFLPSTSVLYAC